MKLLLNLVHPTPRPSRLGWLILAVGLAAALWVGWRYTQTQHRLGEARQAVSALAPPPAKAPRGAQAQHEVSALAQAAQRALEADWAVLLVGLEKSRPKDIALLTVEADAGQGRLRLEANARNLPAMLAYLEGLEGAGLGQVRLQSHTAMEDEGQEYVHFTATATWGGPGVKP